MPLYDWNDPNVPMWQKAGFGSQAEFEAVYGQGATSTAPVAPALSPVPVSGDTGPSAYELAGGAGAALHGSTEDLTGPSAYDLAGGASAPAQAQVSTPAPPSLAGDPTYLAFQRALGLERSTAATGNQSSIDAINQATALRLPQIADAGGISRENIAGNYETRGVLRSSQTETAMARQRQAEANQSSGVTNDAAARIAALNQNLAQQNVGFDTRDVEAQQASAQRQTDAANTQNQQATYQAGLAAQLAAQKQSNDALAAQYQATLAQYGQAPSTSTPAGGATSTNPYAGKVGIVPLDPNDPQYVAKMLAQLKGS